MERVSAVSRTLRNRKLYLSRRRAEMARKGQRRLCGPIPVTNYELVIPSGAEEPAVRLERYEYSLSAAMVSNRVQFLRNAILMVSVGPLRCLAMRMSARSRSSGVAFRLKKFGR